MHTFATVNPRSDIVSTRPRHILPRDIANLQPTAIAVAVRIDARRDVYRLVHILEVEVPERDISHVALAGIRLDPRGV
jgi:hypothetical protein